VFAARVRPAQDFQSGPGKPASSSDDWVLMSEDHSCTVNGQIMYCWPLT
jgi:hypothetical protein